ncbi:uncharacterized protein PAS_chr3_1219 [Komagataella phaffii GS115]|uniref:Uncharacterized protein n=1 Tax=Komagataella phaffii (strain GS115 / ATCC 20864) TaxID=644223 RepID=C4R5J5_KOMPG|nr:uncharacterized protein PAS_chr3_1219 [Komagataella phaffii GS115]CAH2449384.1 Conserved predicted protein [Komagataella phaffii CBS 7435]CAY70831.1 hypothetical protein PAS_chr3_1219 [Komagataella phaffii GS115]
MAPKTILDVHVYHRAHDDAIGHYLAFPWKPICTQRGFKTGTAFAYIGHNYVVPGLCSCMMETSSEAYLTKL